jgi:hypothetical protein
MCLEQYQQAINKVLNSVANPLPTREKPHRIPLPDGLSGSIQSIDLTCPFGDEGARLRPKKRAFPLPSAEMGNCKEASGSGVSGATPPGRVSGSLR